MADSSKYSQPAPVAAAFHHDRFSSALRFLADRLGLVAGNEPMPISKFKASYGDLLEAASKGPQQLSRGRERYVVLTEAQVIALAQSSARPASLAETLSSIKAPSAPLGASAAMVRGAPQDQFSLTPRAAV